MKKIKAIIFDLDGVLISTDHYHYLAWKKVADDLNISFDESVNHLLRGVSRLDSLDIILDYNNLQMSMEEKEQIAEEKNYYYKQYLENLSSSDVDKDIIKTLDALKRTGIKMAIGSSSKNAVFILKQTQLIDYFDVISDGRNIKQSKPNPEVFLKAAQHLLVDPVCCMVIEDAEAGIIAANKANMVSVGINHIAGSDLADYSVQNFNEIEDLVAKEFV